ncbi:MAG: PQQ-binding-like beta-propeller repeat protein [Rhodospirillaceae bacterium]|nr:PQQ-binding-like beta-propeller repeat protein [Rhodospirillaceae bacterium]
MRAFYLAVLIASFAGNAIAGDWPWIGGNISNTRHAAGEKRIGPDNAAKLAPVWSTAVRGVQQETPVADKTTLYVANGQGGLFWIARADGKIIREVNVAEAMGVPGVSARGLGLSDTAVIFGTRSAPYVAAFDKNTGALLWKTKVDEHPLASVTQPPLVYKGRVYVGTSGLGEEVQASYGTYKECCRFRGAVLALDAKTGALVWKTHTIPDGFGGGSIWSRMPSMDTKRNTLYITTGNLYRTPQPVQDCVDAAKAAKDEKALLACWPANTWNDSIIALNPDTGAIKWGFRADHMDIFTGACLRPDLGAFCGGGDDVDFGNGALIWKDLVGAGQKTGTFWALNPDTGKVAWTTNIGPAGPTGGILKGSATDGTRIYAASGNAKQVFHFPKSHTLPNGQTIQYGSFAAMDAATGKIVWQVADPAGAEFPGNDKECKIDSPREDCGGAFPKGPVTVANGVVYACSTAPDGPMYAFHAATGALLWTFKSGAPCDSGAAVIDGVVYWVGGRTLHAFGVPK